MSRFEVVAISEKDNEITVCSSSLMSHNAACVMVKRFSSRPVRRMQLREVVDFCHD